jgi:hypothetical protein
MSYFDQYIKKVNGKKPINELNIQFTQSKGRKGVFDFKKDVKEQDPEYEDRFTGRKRKLALKINEAIISKSIEPLETILHIINFLNPASLRDVEVYMESRLSSDSVEDVNEFSPQDDMVDEEDFLSKIN